MENSLNMRGVVFRALKRWLGSGNQLGPIPIEVLPCITTSSLGGKKPPNEVYSQIPTLFLPAARLSDVRGRICSQ